MANGSAREASPNLMKQANSVFRRALRRRIGCGGKRGLPWTSKARGARLLIWPGSFRHSSAAIYGRPHVRRAAPPPIGRRQMCCAANCARYRFYFKSAATACAHGNLRSSAGGDRSRVISSRSGVQSVVHGAAACSEGQPPEGGCWPTHVQRHDMRCVAQPVPHLSSAFSLRFSPATAGCRTGPTQFT